MFVEAIYNDLSRVASISAAPASGKAAPKGK